MGLQPPNINTLIAWSGQVKRIWQIEEQVVEDPATKLRLEFSSVHSDEVKAGNEAPSHDELVVLRLWTSDRNRMATFLFERNGRFVKCDVEPLSPVITQSEMDQRIANEPGVRRTEPLSAPDEDHHWNQASPVMTGFAKTVSFT